MTSYEEAENTRRRLKFGFPEFPPTETVFVDREFQYFITIAPPDGDLDEIREMATGEFRKAGAFLITEVVELVGALLALVFKNPHASDVAVTRARVDTHSSEWDVVFRESVSTLDEKHAAELRLCALLKDWESLRQHKGDDSAD